MWKLCQKNRLLRLVLFLVMGVFSYFLWAIRTRFCVLGLSIPVSCIVFLEELLGLATIFLVVRQGDKYDMLAYSVGCAVGAGIGTYLGIGSTTPA